MVPLPTHYEPYESPVTNPVYKQQRNPIAKTWKVRGNPYHEAGDAAKYLWLSLPIVSPNIISGSMSRWLPWLAELMPELFIEMSPELATEKKINNGDWVTVVTARGEVEGRALVTKRIRPFVIDGKTSTGSASRGIGVIKVWRVVTSPMTSARSSAIPM